MILKSFEAPDEVRVMQKGRFEINTIGARHGIKSSGAFVGPAFDGSCDL